MINDSLIEFSNQDNKWYEINIDQPDQIPYHEKQIDDKCNLCFSVLQGESHIYKTIERNLNLCNECNNRISDINLPEQRNNIVVYDAFYSKTITITQPNDVPLYNIKIGYCDVCYEDEQILVKLNYCNHYCCNDCLSKYITQNLKTSKKLLCIQQGCQLEINDYLIIQYLSYDEIRKWNKFIYTQFCYSRRCSAKFTLIPYNNLQQNNIYEFNSEICCISCKKRFCKICWTEHKGQCNFEKLFLEYKFKNNIINCPNCNCLGFPEICYQNDGICSEFQVNSLECFICKKQFCLDCKGQLQLFESINIDKFVTCQICKTKHKTFIHKLKRILQECTFKMIAVLIIYLSILSVAVFLACGFLIVVAIYISLYQLFQVSQWVWNFTRNKLLPSNSGLAIAIFPLLLIFMVTAVLLIYVIGFIPLLVINIRRYFNVDNAI